MSQDLAGCPFCGAGRTQIEPNGRMWAGTRWGEPTSVSVRHWCEPVAGQPSRMIERIGRDEASAIEAWNRRAPDRALNSGEAGGATLYVEVRECASCGHVGINDENGTAACNTCDWSGPSPKEDHCPWCSRDGTMTSACPKCGCRSTLLASANLSAGSVEAAEAARRELPFAILEAGVQPRSEPLLFVEVTPAQASAVLAERDRLAADARRYRYLRTEGWDESVHDEVGRHLLDGERLDAAIDAAIATQGAKG